MASLLPFLFDVDLEQLAKLRYRVCALPPKLYDAIRDAQGIERGRKPRLTGLDAVVGWAAPIVDALGEWRDPRANANTLRFISLDCDRPADNMEKQLRRCIALWLGLSCPPEKASALAAMLEPGSGRNASLIWSAPKAFPTRLVAGGTSASPQDPLLFDLITIAAARQLESQVINENTPHEGRLILTNPHLYSSQGQKLIRSRPSPADLARSEFGVYFTEVFTLRPRTDPDRKIIQLTVNVSTRTYGNGLPSRDRRRHLDLFVKPNNYFGEGSERARSIELGVHYKDIDRDKENDSNIWARGDRVWIDEIIKHDFPNRQWSGLGVRSIQMDDFAIMIRRGPGHGDKTIVGAGVSGVERLQYLKVLEQRLAQVGMKRVALERVKHQQSTPKSLKLHRVSSPSDRRAQILASGLTTGDHTLHICLLQQDSEGLPKLDQSMDEVLGPVESKEQDRRQYPDGLKVAVHVAPAGVASESLPLRAELALAADLSEEARKRIVKAEEARHVDAQLRRIEAHIKASFDTVPRPAPLIIEMDARTRDEPRQDPYSLNYEAGQRLGFAVQAKLVAEAKADENPDETSKAELAKSINVLLDVLRSSGVSALQAHNLEIHGWWMLKSWFKGDRLESPCRVMQRGSRLSVALLEPGGDIVEVDYPKAQTLVGLGQVFNLSSRSREEKVATAERFFARVLPHTAQKALIFAEGDNLRQYVRGLQNRHLTPDLLEFGRAGAASALASLRSGGNHSLVRISAEAGNRPAYVVDGNKGGVTAGLFREASSTRVFWVVRRLITAQDLDLSARRARTTSRFDPEAKRLSSVNRNFPAMTEIYPLVIGAGLQADQLAFLTRQALGVHMSMRWQRDEAVLPFPLHEASKLEND
jgi:hypothetical protein